MKKSLTCALTLAAGATFASVYTATEPPKIDGELTEPSWKAAGWERVPAASAAFAVQADDENLYIAWKALEKAKSVSLDLGLEKTDFDFYRFTVDAEGGKKAAFFSESGNIQPDPYHPAWKCAVAKTQVGWTAEAVIPLSAFYMTRNTFWKSTWKTRLGAGEWTEVSGFPVRAIEEDVYIKAAVPRITGSARDGRPTGVLKLYLYAAKAGTFTLETTCGEKQILKIGAGHTEQSIPATFKGRGRNMTAFKLQREGSKAILARTYPVVVDFDPLALTFTKPAYRTNFYPGQNTDQVVGKIVSPVKSVITMELSGPGFPTRKLTVPSGGGPFTFDTKGFKEGVAQLKIVAGNESKTVKIRKILKNPTGGCISWIENGNLVVNGKPVFRRNMYATYYMGGELFQQKYDADEMKLCETLHIDGCGTLEPDRLIKGLEEQEATKDVKPCPELFAAMDRVIDRALASTSTNCVSYYISDEPECRHVSPVYLRYMYDYVCDRDPYHVILCGSRAGETYIDCADWFETHPYLNAHWDTDGKRVYGRHFRDLGTYVDAFKPDEHPDKCIGCMPTCFAYSSGTYATFREYVTHTWNFLIHGVRTYQPYAYHDLGDTPILYRGVKFTNETAERLSDFFLVGTRKMILRTDDAEAATWTLPDKRQLVAAVNMTDKPCKLRLSGVTGKFVEFRGTRTYGAGSFGANLQLDMAPYEAIALTSVKMDAGLTTYDEAAAEVDKLEYARLHRDNQLLGREKDVTVTTSTSATGARKMFDGTRDVIAWYDTWGGDKFYEIAFPKFMPVFRRAVIYGRNIDGVKVKVRANGDWRELTPLKTAHKDYALAMDFGETITTVKIRFEFPNNKLELYEIELPKVAGAEPREFAAKPLRAMTAAKTYWTVSAPQYVEQGPHWKVDFEPGQEFLVFDFRKPRIPKDGAYVNWGLFVDRLWGHLVGNVTRPQPGLYTIRLPKITERRTEIMQFRLYNVALDISDIACVKGPSDFAELLMDGDTYHVRVGLSEPCEDISCAFWCDPGTGPQAYTVNGTSTLPLKPLDASRRKWGADVKLNRLPPKTGPRPAICVTVLGGGLDRPIYSVGVKMGAE